MDQNYLVFMLLENLPKWYVLPPVYRSVPDFYRWVLQSLSGCFVSYPKNFKNVVGTHE